MPPRARLTRRAFTIGAVLATLTSLTALPAHRAFAYAWHNPDVTGVVPNLSFDMTDANTGKPVTQADFTHTFTLLYFGYTQCPDICPLTLQRVTQVFDKLGKDKQHFRLLFVTVDPNRDTLPILKQYTHAFSPLITGLRGDDNAIARLARRYRIAYSVTPATKDHPYEVTHSSAIYVFTPDGAPRLLLGSLATTTPDINGTAEDLEHLLHAQSPSLLSRLIGSL